MSENSKRRFKPGDRVNGAARYGDFWTDCRVMGYIDNLGSAWDGYVRLESSKGHIGTIHESELEPFTVEPTDAERRLAELAAENDRLRDRVDELLAANNAEVEKRRNVFQKLLAAEADVTRLRVENARFRDDLDGARHENGTAWAIVERYQTECRDLAKRLTKITEGLFRIADDEPDAPQKAPEWVLRHNKDGSTEVYAPEGAYPVLGSWTETPPKPGEVYQWAKKGAPGNPRFFLAKEDRTDWQSGLVFRTATLALLQENTK